jgi:hypothetical protein
MERKKNRIPVALFILVAGIIFVAYVQGSETNGRKPVSEKRTALPVATVVPTQAALYTRSEPAKTRGQTAIQDRRTYLAGLRNVFPGDPDVESLAAYAERHSRLGIVVRRGATRTLDAIQAEEPWFEMSIVTDEEHRLFEGHLGVSQWMFEDQWNLMFIPPPDQYTELWRTVMFAHELVHARNFKTGKVPSNASEDTRYSDPKWMANELEANDLQQRLVDDATGGQYSERVMELLFEIEDVDAFTAQARNGDMTLETYSRVDNLFPSIKSYEEARVRAAHLLTAINFKHIGLRGGGDDERLAYLMGSFKDMKASGETMRK